MLPGDATFPLGIRHVRMYAALVALRRRPFSSWERENTVRQHRAKLLLLLCAASGHTHSIRNATPDEHM